MLMANRTFATSKSNSVNQCLVSVWCPSLGLSAASCSATSHRVPSSTGTPPHSRCTSQSSMDARSLRQAMAKPGCSELAKCCWWRIPLAKDTNPGALKAPRFARSSSPPADHGKSLEERTMSIQDNKALVRRFFDEGLEQGEPRSRRGLRLRKAAYPEAALPPAPLK